MEVEYIRLKRPIRFGFADRGIRFGCQECYRLPGTYILFRLSKGFKKRLNPKVFLCYLIMNGCLYSTLESEDQVDEVLWKKDIQNKTADIISGMYRILSENDH